MSQENVEVVRQGFPSEVWDEAVVQRLYDEFWHPDIDYRAAEGEIDDVGVMRGRDAVRAHYEDWLELFDEVRVELTDLDDAGDQIVAPVRMSGRAKASGAATELPFAVALTIRDGKCIRAREYMTRKEALEAVGLRG